MTIKTETSVIGNWTYRSFYNKPDMVTDFNQIKLWEADLVLESDGPFLVKGTLSNAGYQLTVRGTVITGSDKPIIRLRAEGVTGTNTQGWIYDYEGELCFKWPDGDEQRPAIVGSVIRSVPHAPDRMAGIVYSFVAVRKTSDSATYELPKPVVDHFASRLHRLHHAVWHGIRNGWNDLGQKTQEALTKLDWAIEGGRTALFHAGDKTRVCTSNGSGEDFLFFHRQMVAMFRILMDKEKAQIFEWKEIPQPGIRGEKNGDMVPPQWPIPGVPHVERRFAALKTDEFFWSRMRWWDFRFKDPAFLSTLKLCELGALIEFSVHNDMHIRWSGIPRDPENNTIIPLGRNPSDFSKKWDSPKYNWLGEFYSSHVHPVFWRLHGWIDDRVTDWFAAHELIEPGSIKPGKKGGIDWFEKGKWVDVDYPWVWPRSLGGFENGHGHGSGGHHHHDWDKERLESLEKVVQILYPPTEKSALLAAEATVSLDNQRAFVIVGF